MNYCKHCKFNYYLNRGCKNRLGEPIYRHDKACKDYEQTEWRKVRSENRDY